MDDLLKAGADLDWGFMLRIWWKSGRDIFGISGMFRLGIFGRDSLGTSGIVIWGISGGFIFGRSGMGILGVSGIVISAKLGS